MQYFHSFVCPVKLFDCLQHTIPRPVLILNWTVGRPENNQGWYFQPSSKGGPQMFNILPVRVVPREQFYTTQWCDMEKQPVHG